ncbi:hypothetical protein GE300_16840 [Rhodobacteraceae bacterium 2CG4]|uniref:Rieske domain-containing protein n=1 Tax=Halovulum marinum TaxID=2662447 RepID=A0A6L5Z563_9RHOB|nr:hypothetical protein [Halovulum marinum]MSU91250.1 hypothetical protein [Halovulum marinum]
MTAGAPPKLTDDGRGQALVGYRANDEWQALLAETGDRLAALDDLDAEARSAVDAALAGIDSVHREALHRLVRLFKDGVLEQVVTDPAIRTLMGMYGLLPEDEAGCRKVWDFLPADPPDVAADPAGAPPHWSPAPVDAGLADGGYAVCRMEEGAFVVARAGGGWFAFAATCPAHGTTMLDGALDGFTWACPAATGCLYDIRSGARMGGGAALDCRPVRQQDGRLLIGFGMPFDPSLPAM